MHTFATPAPITTVLEIPAGRVRFVAAARTDTTVDVLPADATRSRDVKAAQQTTVDYAGGVLRIHADSKGQPFGPTGSLQVTVHLPADSRVRATAGSAELHTTGRLGEVDFDGAYSQIHIDEAAALRLTAVDGDVAVGRLAGPAEINTARGDIRVAEAVRGTVVLRTQAGGISIGTAAGVSARLDAGTSLGRISNALTNNGTVELDIHATTAQGDIVAHSL
jgi:Putative adhesin